MPERARTALDLLSADVDRFQQLVEDLLEISRFDAGAIKLHLEEVLVAEMVIQAVSVLGGGGVPVRYDDEVSTVVVRVDKRRFARVLANLLDNADKYAGGATGVNIELLGVRRCRSPSRTRATAWPRPSARSSSTASPGAARAATGASDSGVGLGLALVDEHVRLHSGRVWVEDRRDGGRAPASSSSSRSCRWRSTRTRTWSTRPRPRPPTAHRPNPRRRSSRDPHQEDPPRHARAVLGLLAVVLSAAGCGIPTEATARPIDPDALPPSLVEQATTTTTPTTAGGRRVPVELFLVSSKGDTEQLASVDADIVNVVDTADLPRQVIEQLIAQRRRPAGTGADLTNAIPPDTQVLNANVEDRRARPRPLRPRPGGVRPPAAGRGPDRLHRAWPSTRIRGVRFCDRRRAGVGLARRPRLRGRSGRSPPATTRTSSRADPAGRPASQPAKNTSATPWYSAGSTSFGLPTAGGQRHPHDLARLQRHHRAEGAVVHRVDGGDAEAGGEHPVERRRRAAALDVAEDRRCASRSRCAASISLGDLLADAARGGRGRTGRPRPTRWPCVPSFGVAPSATTTIEA